MLLYKHIALYTFNASTYTHNQIPGNAGRFFIIPNISSGCSRMNFVIEKNRPVGTQHKISIYNAVCMVVRILEVKLFFRMSCSVFRNSKLFAGNPPSHSLECNKVFIICQDHYYKNE